MEYDDKLDRYDMVFALEDGLKAALAELKEELRPTVPQHSNEVLEEYTRNVFDGMSFREAFSRVLNKAI